VIHFPALSSQKDVQPPVTVSNTNSREIFKSNPKSYLNWIVPDMPIPLGSPVYAYNLASPSLAYYKADPQELDQRSFTSHGLTGHALQLFSYHLLEHSLVQSQVSHQLFETSVLVFQLP
jgi:hypothetical protein